jgi:hypothetical protein
VPAYLNQQQTCTIPQTNFQSEDTQSIAPMEPIVAARFLDQELSGTDLGSNQTI